MNAERVLLIPKIQEGYVIDHIPAGFGDRVLRLIRQTRSLKDAVITIGLNCESRRLGRKDLVKIQVPELTPRFLQHLSILCSGISVKRIRDYVVETKIVLDLPEMVDRLLHCPNPVCITNHERDSATCFHLVRREPLAFRCNYCERHFSLEELDFEGTLA